jgi:hypothetical protein
VRRDGFSRIEDGEEFLVEGGDLCEKSISTRALFLIRLGRAYQAAQHKDLSVLIRIDSPRDVPFSFGQVVVTRKLVSL